MRAPKTGEAGKRECRQLTTAMPLARDMRVNIHESPMVVTHLIIYPLLIFASAQPIGAEAKKINNE